MLKELSKAVLASLVISGAAVAAGPAVSDFNGKVEGFAGSVDGNHLEGGAASFTMPLSDSLGLQLDAVHGQRGVDAAGTDELKGVGAHLFTRDPESYLLGAIAYYGEVGDISIQGYGVEGEAYVGDFTVFANAGHLLGDVDDDGFGQIGVNYYPIDDLALTVQGQKNAEFDRWGVAAEYQTPVSGLSLFAEANEGNNRFDSALAGVRYYFSGQKSLKARHREDDPGNTVSNILTGTPGATPPAPVSEEE